MSTTQWETISVTPATGLINVWRDLEPTAMVAWLVQRRGAETRVVAAEEVAGVLLPAREFRAFLRVDKADAAGILYAHDEARGAWR